MNCKKGDVAMFIRSASHEVYGHEFVVPRGTFVFITGINVIESVKRRGWFWNVERQRVVSVDGRFSGDLDLVRDSLLRPIRPGEGADETLTWAGKPVRAPVHSLISEEAGA